MPLRASTYRAALNLISHLVLTKPKVVQGFLRAHGRSLPVHAKGIPLTDAFIELIATGREEVLADLEKLFAAHLKFKGEELTGQQEDAFLTGALSLATGLAKGIGGLFNKKKKRRQAAKDQKRAREAAMAQAKSDAAQRLQMFRMKMAAQKSQARKEEEKQRQRNEEKAERERQAKASNQRTMMMAGGGVLVLVLALGYLKGRPAT